MGKSIYKSSPLIYSSKKTKAHSTYINMNAKKPLILDLNQILKYLPEGKVLRSLIGDGFVALSSGKAVVPPVGELLFDNPPGETHLKYGYIQEQPFFVIKIASGFYENPKLGLKSSQGLMLVFSQRTGELKCILLDQGYLTDLRTTIASMLTVQYLAPTKVTAIGIVGTGTQAKLQLKYLSEICKCDKVMVWGRNSKQTAAYKKVFKDSAYKIEIATDLPELTAKCNLIITTTAATAPLLKAPHLKTGTHITALGSDTAAKIELEPQIIQKADLLVTDSLAQSKSRGEFFRAEQQNCLDKSKLIELGALVKNPNLGRQNNEQITIADLTGVAVQDIMIATTIFNNYNLLQHEYKNF